MLSGPFSGKVLPSPRERKRLDSRFADVAVGPTKQHSRNRTRCSTKLVIHLFFAYNIPMALTKRQKEFLDFLSGFLEKRGYSPSYEEIAEGLSLASLATVHKHILALESKHYVKRGFNQSRSLELAPKYYDEQRQHRPPSLEIPLLGRIAAGAPVE